VLESATNLVPPIIWSPENLTFGTSSSNSTVTITNIGGDKFYRLSSH
jgi:hypothetical protein